MALFNDFGMAPFDARNEEPLKDFTPLPTGEYDCIIISSENKRTKAGTGMYLKLVLQVIKGEHQNRQLYTNLNLQNPNPKAVQIARAELSSICRAIGVPTPNDSAELHNKPMAVKVKCAARKDNGELENQLKGYSAIGGTQVAQQPVQQPVQQSVQQPTQHPVQRRAPQVDMQQSPEAAAYKPKPPAPPAPGQGPGPSPFG